MTQLTPRYGQFFGPSADAREYKWERACLISDYFCRLRTKSGFLVHGFMVDTFKKSLIALSFWI